MLVRNDYRMRMAEISVRGQRIQAELARKTPPGHEEDKDLLTGHGDAHTRIVECMDSINLMLQNHSITEQEIKFIRAAIDKQEMFTKKVSDAAASNEKKVLKGADSAQKKVDRCKFYP